MSLDFTNDDADTTYDLILFGVTGFTGKLAVEYLLRRHSAGGSLRWAACARDRPKAEAVLQEIVDGLNQEKGKRNEYNLPPLLIADLVCNTLEQENRLCIIVEKARVVLSCCGPFELYGTTLVKLCANAGVDYADITGETDFVRSMIAAYDSKAQTSGARIVCHCGNDCIPQDLLVYEMHQYAQQHGQHPQQLVQVQTCVELADTAAWSGGTAATATYQLSKDRNSTTLDKSRPPFDPLLMNKNQQKSEFKTKNISPKHAFYDKDLFGSVEPWIMGPVMVNCVRRSNALLGYSKELRYGDMRCSQTGWAWWTAKMTEAGMYAALQLPTWMHKHFLPKVGQGPDRETMEAGYMTLHARGIMIDKNNDNKKTKLTGEFHFNKDIAYLYTAALLVETGILLFETKSSPAKTGGGVLTPAAALGSQLTRRILERLEATLEIKELDESEKKEVEEMDKKKAEVEVDLEKQVADSLL